VSFASPYLLLGLLVVPAAAGAALWLERRPHRYRVAFTNLELLAAVAATTRRRKRLLPFACFLLGVAAAALALARPRVESTHVTRGATVILLVDVSGSMTATDMPPSRLAAAETALDAFSARIPPTVRVGLVSFNSIPYVLVRPTLDRTELRDAIAELSPTGGTAIGDALRLAVAVARGATSDPAPAPSGARAAIVLLSDGAQTDGRLTPLAGAALARGAGIPVDTVALGTDSRSAGFGPFGGYGFGSLFMPDPVTLAAIATVTGGHTFRARTAARAVGVYRTLGTSIVRSRSRHEVTSWFSGAAAFLLLGTFAAARRAPRALP
jgi:Ca-activated chloride channel family protein